MIAGDHARVEIGDNTNVQDGSTVTTSSTSLGVAPQDTIIGSNVTIGHQASIHGCKIGDEALIGMGATLLDGSRVCYENVALSVMVMQFVDNYDNNLYYSLSYTRSYTHIHIQI